ncbi:TonB-dependent siderophore receptor [Acetobacter sp. DsW_063]|uniref:TonB-dependent receptor plug domain-containing protein n=1 Tax=Acetobacter sp. DsW_063 TaxID=1514894 RepID=UPI000B6374B6|nr:TonB-dependent receptor [Acetobacter sp. DsW_063]OUJ15978.1 membrane protein [Acetobacter sp. DsW_063]
MTRLIGLKSVLLCGIALVTPTFTYAASSATATKHIAHKHISPVPPASTSIPAAGGRPHIVARSQRSAVRANASPEQIDVAGRTIGTSVLSPSTPVHSTTQVTVVSGAQLLSTGQTNVMSALAQASAAITAPPQPGVGNNAFVQTMQLRGQSADDTLILVNGHRRHLGANFNANAGPNWGTEPADISLIPISAIDHIEVITEGASALYGAEAIAGAVNIVLKNRDHGGSVNFQNSGFYAGDGQAVNGYADYGMKLGRQGGYLDLAAQVTHQQPSNRSGDFVGQLYPAGDSRNETASRDVNRMLGVPKSTMETLSENMEIPLAHNVNLYSTSTFGHRRVNVAETYRSAANSLTNSTLWPNGAIPYIAMDQYDFETDNGIKAHALGFSWDAYVNYGRDDQAYSTIHSNNVSLGDSSPRNFYDGKAITSELSAGVRGSREFRTSWLPKPIGLRFGGEYRRDTFQMTEGERDSWYGLGATDHGGNIPAAATNRSRDIYEGNVNLDFFVTKNWEWTIGGRATSYSHLATVETGSIGTRYNFNRNWAIRASVNTGYRPPTLGQTYYFYNAPFATYSVDQLPNSSAAAQALGAGKIKGEYSRSYSVGLDATPLENWHFTGNLYYIAINDRLASTTTLGGTEVADILASSGLQNVTYASYYTNPLNTQTYGGDISTDYTLHTQRAGTFKFAFTFNYSDNEVRSYNKTPAVLAQYGLSSYNKYAEQMLLHSAPKNRESLSLNWNRGRWGVFVQEQRYGSTLFLASPTAAGVTQRPAFLTNLEVSYKILPQWSLAIGANNLGNKYPTRIPKSISGPLFGAYKYSYYSPYGFNGGMYYVRTNFSF